MVCKRINVTIKLSDSMKRGQISIDLVLAVMFLLLISLIIYYNIFYSEGGLVKASKVDRVYTIAQCFENYVLMSYSNNVEVTAKFEPIGDKIYIIYFKNKKIVVNTTKTVKFSPTKSGVIVSGDIEDSNITISDNKIRINVTYGNFYVEKDIAVNITA